MFYIISAIVSRIVSNSYINVFQKILTQNNSSSVINFYTYATLALLSIAFLNSSYFSYEIIMYTIITGILGALGNYFIIKALSIGELSVLAPINSYKPVVALIFSFLLLQEIPTSQSILGILFIILGTHFMFKNSGKINFESIFYRLSALLFSGIESIFIKKLILLTNVKASFCLWAISGAIFAFLFAFLSPQKNHQKIVIKNYKPFIFLVLSVGIMQYSTNYVFSKMHVASALALFQLSSLLSVYLGAEIFHENELKRKLISTFIMIIGAVTILLQ